jgi:hypothetical protein
MFHTHFSAIAPLQDLWTDGKSEMLWMTPLWSLDHRILSVCQTVALQCLSPQGAAYDVSDPSHVYAGVDRRQCSLGTRVRPRKKAPLRSARGLEQKNTSEAGIGYAALMIMDVGYRDR